MKNLKIGFWIVFLLWSLSGFTQNQTINVNQLSGETITLPHNQNDLTLEYVGIHFDNPEKTTYQYKMEGVHEDWVNVGTERTARFNNLKPGNYVFFVKAANADGVWNKQPTSLNIKILAPWYWTWWSKIAYLLLTFFGLYRLYQFQLNKKLVAEETRRLRELDEVKTKMYTNITHEFRTPLSVIQGVADGLSDNEKAKDVIRRNSLNLLSLVNQMLDLSKLESGKLPIQMIQGDVISYLSYLAESFQSLAIDKNIRLHFLSKMPELKMDYDPDKLMKIIANLISNAIKFSARGGDVYLLIEEAQAAGKGRPFSTDRFLQIQVKDNGIGISKEALSHIFDRFYQVDDSSTRKGEGTGIGLAFAKELVRILKGKISVQSEIGKGAIFTVLLPITQQARIFSDTRKLLARDMIVQQQSTERLTDEIVSKDNHPIILLVEDNRDVMNYLASCLEGKYQLAFAEDGTEGIEKAIQIVPDLIISDVMMPGRDGFELCDYLKKDIRTSHIPIVLLTAKADIDSKIKGIQKGADAYLAKPFNREELLVRLEQLIALRQVLQTRFSNNKIAVKEEETLSLEKFPLENEFIQKARQIILENMESEQFDSTQFARMLAMSPSQLYRKLKALTGKSTAIYIRFIRLQKAKELLQTTTKNVSQVAYSVGFKDLAYFSRCFSEEFGINPSKVKKG